MPYRAPYLANGQRYQEMVYRRCGRTGLLLPAVSLGLWHNFAGVDTYENARAMVLRAFDLGVTHFDLANNYGPPPGSAEETFGQIMAQDLRPYRDELIISTKAGYYMWPGPYGEWGSRKYLLASLDQSLKRMGLDYVDIFYSHRPDPDTPLEETMLALDQAVRSGKALYVGISTYTPEQARAAVAIAREVRMPLIIHQPAFNMFNRWIETDHLIETCAELGIGIIAFSPLAQGMLSTKYLKGIPEDSRAAKAHGFLRCEEVSDKRLGLIVRLNEIAQRRGQTLAQLAIAWVLRHPEVTSALVGASRVSQVEDDVAALSKLDFTPEELDDIEAILREDTEPPVW